MYNKLIFIHFLKISIMSQTLQLSQKMHLYVFLCLIGDEWVYVCVCFG